MSPFQIGEISSGRNGISILTKRAQRTAHSVRPRGASKGIPSISPCRRLDGGWGVILQAQAFQNVARNTFSYFQGSYLVSPRQTNRTQSPYGDLPDLTGEDRGCVIDSLAGQYVGCAGVSRIVGRRKDSR